MQPTPAQIARQLEKATGKKSKLKSPTSIPTSLAARQGDRGSDEADVEYAAVGPRFVRFRELKERGICDSWRTLRRWIAQSGFPPGRLLGMNSRAWTEAEVEAWLAARPTAAKPVPPKNKAPPSRAA